MTMARKRTEAEQAQETPMEQAKLAGEGGAGNVMEAAPAQKPTEVVKVGGILRLFFSSQHDLEAWLANIERLEAERAAQVETEAAGDIPDGQ